MNDQSNKEKNFLVLIALLLAFLLVLVFIWVWYDLKNTSLEKEGRMTSKVANH